MPIYMDRHDVPGVTAKAVAEAHQEDLKIQHKYNCRGLTYWFDEDKGMAFCLVEAPNKECVKKLHDDAHGLIPHQVIEVERGLVESFLGRIEDPDPPENQEASDFVIIKDPAFRSIMAIDLSESLQLNANLSTMSYTNRAGIFKDIFMNEVKNHHGNPVEHLSEGYMASFSSINQSVLCALAILDDLLKHEITISNDSTGIQIGLSAGVPVMGEEELFGPVVRLARRLCAISSSNKIMVDSAINDLYDYNIMNKRFNVNSLVFINPTDEYFINEMMDVIEAKWNDPLLGVETLSYEMGISKSQLYRRITNLMGYSPNDFIKEYRLKNAFKSIQKQKGNITDIAYECGFSSLSYFTKCFLKRFGITPSHYASVIF